MPYKIWGPGAMKNFGGCANLRVYCYTVEADATEPTFFGPGGIGFAQYLTSRPARRSSTRRSTRAG